MKKFIIGETDKLDIDYENIVTDFSIVEDGKHIGDLKISIENDTCNLLYISIKEEYKRNKYATKTIEQLNKKYTIIGDCLPKEDSISFWRSMGAEFDEEVIIEECIKYNSCIPFLLY